MHNKDDHNKKPDEVTPINKKPDPKPFNPSANKPHHHTGPAHNPHNKKPGVSKGPHPRGK